MSTQSDQQRHEPDTETIVECAGCEKRFLEQNADDQNLEPPNCPYCGTPIQGPRIESDHTEVLVGDRRRLRFAGGVTADVRLSGDADLQEHVLRELERAVEYWRARFTGSDGTGGQVTSEHQQRCIETLPEPLNWLASDIVALNEHRWLQNGAHADTIGAQNVREHGFTNNQQEWIGLIADAMQGGEADV